MRSGNRIAQPFKHELTDESSETMTSAVVAVSPSACPRHRTKIFDETRQNLSAEFPPEQRVDNVFQCYTRSANRIAQPFKHELTDESSVTMTSIVVAVSPSTNGLKR